MNTYVFETCEGEVFIEHGSNLSDALVDFDREYGDDNELLSEVLVKFSEDNMKQVAVFNAMSNSDAIENVYVAQRMQ